MFIEIFTVLITVWGSVSLLYYLLFKFISWGTYPGITLIYAAGDGSRALAQLEAERKTAELTGAHKKQQIIIVDYGLDSDGAKRLLGECRSGSNTYYCCPDSLCETLESVSGISNGSIG
ncbi:MAG: hypothetical protein GX051_04420 [Clostridiales bacterium]|nr:hypothetical protein [Clostridiales bacterium]